MVVIAWVKSFADLCEKQNQTIALLVQTCASLRQLGEVKRPREPLSYLSGSFGSALGSATASSSRGNGYSVKVREPGGSMGVGVSVIVDRPQAFGAPAGKPLGRIPRTGRLQHVNTSEPLSKVSGSLGSAPGAKSSSEPLSNVSGSLGSPPGAQRSSEPLSSLLASLCSAPAPKFLGLAPMGLRIGTLQISILNA